MSKKRRAESFADYLKTNIAPIPSIIEIFIIAKKAQMLSDKTVNLYETQLAKMREFMLSMGVELMSEMDEMAINRFIIHKAKTCQPRTVHIAYRIMRTFTYWYEKYTQKEYISPFHNMKAPKIPKGKKKICDTEQFRTILGGCKGKFAKRDKAIMLLAFDSGLRMSEIIDLNIQDVNIVSGQIEVLEGKGGKYRVSFLSDVTLRAVRAYLKERTEVMDVEAPLFLSKYNARFSPRGFESLLKRIQGRAGIKVGGYHSFRRGFGTEFVRNGGNIFQLQELYGHEEITTTRDYVGLDDKDLRKAHAEFTPTKKL